MRKFPKYRKHADRDWAFIEVRGRRIRLDGGYNSVESRAHYFRLQGEWWSNGGHLPSIFCTPPVSLQNNSIESPQAAPAAEKYPSEDDKKSAGKKSAISISELCRFFLQERETYFLHDRTSYNHYCRSIGFLVDGFGEMPVSDFRPKDLQFLQGVMVESGFARQTINKYISFIKQCFRFGVLYHDVPSATYATLMLVENLKMGHTVASEYKKILPVPLRGESH